MNVADEIADHFDLIGIVIRNLYAGELIFNQDHQFKAIEPVGAEIIAEVGVIRDIFDIDIQLFGNKSAHFIDVKASRAIRCLLGYVQAAEGHGWTTSGSLNAGSRNDPFLARQSDLARVLVNEWLTGGGRGWVQPLSATPSNLAG
jgi:hypothetical protein